MKVYLPSYKTLRTVMAVLEKHGHHCFYLGYEKDLDDNKAFWFQTDDDVPKWDLDFLIKKVTDPTLFMNATLLDYAYNNWLLKEPVIISISSHLSER